MFGGPSCFVEDADGFWRKYMLPEGKRLENGDKITMKDCTVLPKTYSKVVCPEHLKPEDSGYKEYLQELAAYTALLERDDNEMVFADGSYVLLVPTP